MSQSRFYPQWDFQVATPKFQVATSLTATHVATSKMMSRPQAAPQSFRLCRNLKISGCNTLKTNPGRDLKLMSQPQTVHPRSQRGFSCYDQGLLTRNLIQVATPKRMSRHQLLQSRSRCQNEVATSPCLAQVVRALIRPWVRTSAVVGVATCAAAPTLRTWCLPVTTSKLGRDPVLEIGNSHSSFCLAQNFLFFFSKPPVAFLPLLGCSSLTHCHLPTQNL